jgi:hypothetical protein
MVPDLQTPQPVIQAQNEAAKLQGTGKGGCGCCSTCGGNKPDEKKTIEPPAALGAPGDKPSKLTANVSGNSVINNVLNWIKQKREAAGTSVQETKPKQTLEDLAKKPPTGSGVSSLPALHKKLKEMSGGRSTYGLPKKPLLVRQQVKKLAIPARVQNLRAKVALKQKDDSSSDDGEHSESDEEAVGRGKKRVNKRSEVVKRVMKQRGISMIEASKIVKSEGLY